MPRFKVVEHRMRRAEYLIDASDEQAARSLSGEILDESEDKDDWGYETVKVERVEDDQEAL